MSAIFFPTIQIAVKIIYSLGTSSVVSGLFNVLHSLFKAGKGLMKIAKVYVMGTRSTDCIY